MNNQLSDKKVLVAGAGGLLGAKIVKNALAQGAQVIATDINLDLMREKLTSQQVNLSCDGVTLAQLDVTNEIEVKGFFSEQKGLTGAVNSTYPRNKTYGAHFLDVSLESFNENVTLHLGSSFLFMQQCATYFLRRKKSFSLVNISSIYGIIAPKFEVYENTAMTMPVEYAAIKSAIIHLNKYVSVYVGSSDFRINSVSPGGIDDGQPQKFLDKYKTKTLGKGMLKVDDVIGAILFLLSDASNYMNGQNLVIDDGFTLS